MGIIMVYSSDHYSFSSEAVPLLYLLFRAEYEGIFSILPTPAEALPSTYGREDYAVIG